MMVQRHLPCAQLYSRGVPCALWFEDAIAFYGTPTALFDIYVLVNDPVSAATELLSCGWKFVDRETKVGNATVDCTLRAMSPPGDFGLESSVSAVLLRASEWNYNLDKCIDRQPVVDKNSPGWMPQLAPLVDALIDTWLDATEANTMLIMHVGCMLAYLYRYTADLHQLSFEVNLREEHRPYHAAMCAGNKAHTTAFRTEQRSLRARAREETQEAVVT